MKHQNPHQYAQNCPKCDEKVYTQGFRSTCLGWGAFEDTEGYEHKHDPNTGSCEFKCTCGHRWNLIKYNTCSCGWSSEFPHKTYHIPASCHNVVWKFNPEIDVHITNPQWIVNLNKTLEDKR